MAEPVQFKENLYFPFFLSVGCKADCTISVYNTFGHYISPQHWTETRTFTQLYKPCLVLARLDFERLKVHTNTPVKETSIW